MWLLTLSHVMFTKFWARVFWRRERDGAGVLVTGLPSLWALTLSLWCFCVWTSRPGGECRLWVTLPALAFGQNVFPKPQFLLL